MQHWAAHPGLFASFCFARMLAMGSLALSMHPVARRHFSLTVDLAVAACSLAPGADAEGEGGDAHTARHALALALVVLAVARAAARAMRAAARFALGIGTRLVARELLADSVMLAPTVLLARARGASRGRR